MFDDARVAAMMGEPYSSYTDTVATYDYLDFMSSWLMPPNIYDVMPLPKRVRVSQWVLPTAQAAETTSEVPFVRLATPPYNIQWAYGGSVRMLHRPNAMDLEELGLRGRFFSQWYTFHLFIF